MRPVKDPLGINAPSVYNMPYLCGNSYIEQAGRTVVIREAEHKHHLHFGTLDKSAVALRSWNMGHTIRFEETS